MMIMPFEKTFFNPWFNPTNHLFSEHTHSDNKTLKVNLYESTKEYLVLVQTESYSKENLDISLNGSKLEIKVIQERKDSELSDTQKPIGKKIHLENPIIGDGITAEYLDGIVKISIPKQAIEGPRSIAIA